MKEHQLLALGSTLRFFRNALNISQEELAHRAGFHRTYIGQIERGERNPSFLNIQILCNTIGVSLPKFFEQYEKEIGKEV